MAGIILGVIVVLLGIGEFFYVLTITNLMKDPANAAAFNEFFEQFSDSRNKLNDESHKDHRHIIYQIVSMVLFRTMSPLNLATRSLANPRLRSVSLLRQVVFTMWPEK